MCSLSISTYLFSIMQKKLADMGGKIEIEVPEYGYFFYVSGKKPYWKVGDILATYDHEGMVELVEGEVKSVEFDNAYYQDWVYTFEDGHKCLEKSLVAQETYSRSPKN